VTQTGSPPAIVRLEDVSVCRRGRSILEGISFEVEPRAFVGVVGPNGAGKTTLLKAILGLVPIARGRIEVFGAAPGERSHAGGGVGYVPQQVAIPAQFPASVLDVVALGSLRTSVACSKQQVLDRLRRVGMARHAARPVGELSGGEQRRVMLAQALCASERLLILDEPTTGLDLPAEQEFYQLLRSLKQELGLSVIAVSHDLLALAGEADQLICINRTMHVHGNPNDVVHSHALQEAYSCEFDFLRGEIAHHEELAKRLDAPERPD